MPPVDTTTDESTTTQPNSSNRTSSFRSSRRSAHTSGATDPVIAPGFGTARDLDRLARDLSQGTGTVLPVAAVQAMMTSRGRGLRSSKGDGNDGTAAAAATPVSSAWADFMKEEGVTDTNVNNDDDNEGTGKRSNRKKKGSDSASAAASSSSSRVYALSQQVPKSKKQKAEIASGVLVQTGTLDAAIVGRSKKFSFEDAHCLTVPTVILSPSIKIQAVYTAGHACHSIAVSTTGQAYGWGRNEAQQLGAALPTNVYAPELLEPVALGDDDEDDHRKGKSKNNNKVKAAAVGKSHTVLLLGNGRLVAVGANKAGQCGVKTATESVNNWRACVFADGSDDEKDIVQIACGEDFSIALDSEGYMYTTGSSEYGQLGNGETGQYFVTANKLAFANCSVFTKRTTFCHAPGEKLHGAGEKSTKVVPFSASEDIRIQHIACGKHHALALEAESSADAPRLFSWGCGDYGVLGHGVQADEYFPRMVGSVGNLRLPAQGASHMAVSAGQHCSLLQTVNGHVYYWGKHRSVGEATMRPTLVDALANNQHVVTLAAAGGQTVVCCTANALTVCWGQGPHGELGLGTKLKSSAKPTFVDGLNGCRIAALACGYGHTLFVVRDDDKEDKAAVKMLPVLDPEATQMLEDNADEAVPAVKKSGKKKKG